MDIVFLQPHGAAFDAGGLRIGQLILQVEGESLSGKITSKIF